MALFDSILYSVPLSLSTVFFRLLLSTLLSGIIGFERGFRGRAAGLRTHILVGIGSTLVVMTGIYGVETLGYAADPMRMAAQVISGIGFLGAGTILVRGKTMVTGLTTAAGLWATAAIGIAVGIGFYPAAVICAVISLFTFICLTTFERGGTYGKYNIRIYVECTDPTALNALLETLSSQEFGLREFEIMPARTGLPNHIGIVAMVIIHRKSEKKERLSKIMEHPSVFIAIESV